MLLKKIAEKFGYELTSRNDPSLAFHSDAYMCHNARRLEHLASLRIPVAGMTVLEVGAGIGDHSHYYLDRGCNITITEARPENLKFLNRRYPGQKIQFLDLEHPVALKNAPFDIVHCYGILYHVANPGPALEFLSENCRRMLFLETCVSFGDHTDIHPVREDSAHPTQSYSGAGCRPTRRWLFEKLQGLFEYVYLPKTQANLKDFPLDWTVPEHHRAKLSRSVFIASRSRIDNELLTQSLIIHQSRHP